MTELQPARDVGQITALTVVRLLMNVIGLQRDPGRGASSWRRSDVPPTWRRSDVPPT